MTVPRRAQRPKVLLDWFTISYRHAVAGALLLVVGLVVAAWYYLQYAPSRPRQEAQEAIVRADERLTEASRYPAGERIDEVRGGARSALTEARDAFGRRKYDDARVAAMRAENFAQKAIDLARGDGTAAKEVRISKMEGDVRVKRADQFNWEQADRKMTLRVGDQIKTASSGSVQLVYFDGAITTIHPGSLLEIRAIHEDPATRVRRVSEQLNWGEVLASTQARNVDGSFHEVATDKVSTRSSDAGEFRVSSDKDSRVASVDVFQGRVQVAAAGRKESVAAGERIRANAGGVLQAKETLPGAPRLVAPSDQKVFIHEDPQAAETTLAWERVPGALRYHLVISDRALFTSPLYEADRDDSTAVVDGIRPGEYFWKVAALNVAGASGPYSEARRFRVTSQKIRDREDTTGPVLELTEKVQTGPMLILNGKTEPGALLWVDNEKVDVYDDGTFYAVIRLRKEGVNDVLIASQDAAGNVSKITQRAYVDPY
jgi:ElaB/YqjD/DUF883 family membrane-anchored ribosome-binding protein